MEIRTIEAKKVVPGDVIVPGDTFMVPHLVKEIGFKGDDESVVVVVTDEDRYEIPAWEWLTVWRRRLPAESGHPVGLELEGPGGAAS